MREHKNASIGKRHAPTNWAVLTIEELSTLIVSADDVQKTAYIANDGAGNPTTYVLTNYDPPTWKPSVSSANSGGGIGTNIKVTLIAGEAISGHTVVTANATGKAIVCDSSIQSPILGVSNNSAITGGNIEIVTSGLIYNTGWNFSINKPVFCSSTGQLTTTPQTTNFQTIVGVSNSQTSMVVNIQPQIYIGA